MTGPCSLLAKVHVPEAHTMRNLATELKTITGNWEIITEVHCAIPDNASNIMGVTKGNQ